MGVPPLSPPLPGGTGLADCTAAIRRSAMDSPLVGERLGPTMEAGRQAELLSSTRTSVRSFSFYITRMDVSRQMQVQGDPIATPPAALVQRATQTARQSSRCPLPSPSLSGLSPSPRPPILPSSSPQTIFLVRPQRVCLALTPASFQSSQVQPRLALLMP